jgi:hypothetical protein
MSFVLKFDRRDKEHVGHVWCKLGIEDASSNII